MAFNLPRRITRHTGGWYGSLAVLLAALTGLAALMLVVGLDITRRDITSTATTGAAAQPAVARASAPVPAAALPLPAAAPATRPTTSRTYYLVDSGARAADLQQLLDTANLVRTANGDALLDSVVVMINGDADLAAFRERFTEDQRFRREEGLPGVKLIDMRGAADTPEAGEGEP